MGWGAQGSLTTAQRQRLAQAASARRPEVGDADPPFIQFFTGTGKKSPSLFVGAAFARILFLAGRLALNVDSGRVVKAKIADAPRRVWRMTAENQLGEILELVPLHGGEDTGGRPHAARPSAGVSVSSVSSLSCPTSSRSTVPRVLVLAWGVTLDPAPVPSWQESSYDLLHGLRVHDVTDKIPTRMFNALFSPDPGDRSPPTKDWS